MFSFSSPTHKESVPRLLAAPPQFSLRRSDGRTRQDRCLLPIAANTFYPFSEALFVLESFHSPFLPAWQGCRTQASLGSIAIARYSSPSLGKVKLLVAAHSVTVVPFVPQNFWRMSWFSDISVITQGCFLFAPPSRLSVCSWEIPLATSCKQTFCLTLKRVPGNLFFWCVASEKQPSCFGRRCSSQSLP